MTSFVIRTEDDEDLGFLLFVKQQGEWPPAGPNECVFSGTPYDSLLLNDPRGRFVTEHNGQEWIAAVNYTDTEITVLIDLDTGWTFELRSNEDGYRWMAQYEEETIGGKGMFF